MTLEMLLMLLLAGGTGKIVLAKRVVCPIVQSGTNNVVVDTEADLFNEISGLVVSPTQLSDRGNPIFFAVNDGGDGPRLGIFDTLTGDHLVTLQVKGATNQDWESLALGPCGDIEGSCIYISDTGDNQGRKSGGRGSSRGQNPYRIYKIREPSWVVYSSGDEVEVEAVLNFDYASFPEFPIADSEALFVDPTGWGTGAAPGDLYVVTKWNRSQAQTNNRIFYIPVSAWSLYDGSVYSPAMLGPWAGDSPLMGHEWTSAEMSPDGTLLALGSYYGVYLFLRCPGASIKSVLDEGESCLYWPFYAPGSQIETIAWMPNGTSTLQIPEGPFAVISYTTLHYDVVQTSHVCPLVEYDELGACRSSDNEIYPDSWCDANNPSSRTTTMPSLVPTAAGTQHPASSNLDPQFEQLGVKTPTITPNRLSLHPSFSPTTDPRTAAPFAEERSTNELPQVAGATSSASSRASSFTASALFLFVGFIHRF